MTLLQVSLVKLTIVRCCSIQLVSLQEVVENNGQAGLVSTAQCSTTIHDLSCSERVGEKHVACYRVVIPTDEMDASEFINRKKMTALSSCAMSQ